MNTLISNTRLITLLILLIAYGCKKEQTPEENNIPDNVTNMDELTVSDDFNWSTTRDIDVIVNVETEQKYQVKSKISVFRGDPIQEGVLMIAGSASAEKPFTEKIRVPAFQDEVYLKFESAIYGSQIVSVPVSGNTITYTFATTKSSQFFNSFKGTGEIGPDCNDCDYVISGNENVTITNGGIYCVTDNFTGSVTFETWNGGGTLQVCGTANIENITLGTDCHIIVTQDGTLTINNLSMWGTSASIMVYENATLIINCELHTQGDFVENQGTMDINGNIRIQNLEWIFINSGILNVTGYVEVNNNTTLNNSGTIESYGSHFNFNNGSYGINSGTIKFISAGNSFKINDNCSFSNSGEVDVTGSIYINSGATVINNCKIMCTETMEINAGTVEINSGYLKSGQTLSINSSSAMLINDGSMVTTTDLYINLSAGITGSGDLNSIIVHGIFTINNNNTISGPIESATDSLVYWSGNIDDYFINGATLVGLDEISNYIPIHECNPEGTGSTIITDTDLDGVPDYLDDYPNDPEKAFNNYYPGEDQNGSLAFEDLWPDKGDYDFNDVVLDYNINQITNADNKVVEIEASVTVRASGAGYRNGFGFELPIAPSAVQDVTGFNLQEGFINLDANNTESNQQNATIIVFDNLFNLFDGFQGGWLNTDPESPYYQPESLTVVISLTNPLEISTLGLPPYNPFIIINKERGRELHLPGYTPTSLIDPSYFGTGDDDSNPETGKYYKSDNNLPWGAHLPVSFDYPIEKKQILEGYLVFDTWVLSGGYSYMDWYLDKTGYRASEYIYQLP